MIGHCFSPWGAESYFFAAGWVMKGEDAQELTAREAQRAANRKLLFLVIGMAVFGVILMLPTRTVGGAGGADAVTLTAQGKASLAVLAMAVILWVTEALPFPVTGLLAIVMLTVTNAGSKASRLENFEEFVRSGFGNPIVMFFIGVLVFSAAVNRTGLLRRFTTVLLFRVGHSPKTIILGFLSVGALASMWITDMAVAAILLPIGVAVLRQARVEKLKSNFGRALMISCAWGPLIGGVATPAGCGPNPLTIKFLAEAGIEFSFGQWMLLGVPAMLLMIPCAWLTLLKCFPLEEVDLRLPKAEANARNLGRFTFKEGMALGVMVLAISVWVGKPLIEKLAGGRSFLSIEFVAVACACLLFLPKIGVLTWKEAQEEIDWGGLVLVLAGLSLGLAAFKTGAATWLATLAFGELGALHPIFQVFLVVLGVSLLKVAFSSNTVTGTIMVPLMIALAKQINSDVRLLAIPAGITASLAFILVTSTPTNVIPYSAGYFSIRDMAKAGIWMTIWASGCVTISIVLMGRFAGIEVFG